MNKHLYLMIINALGIAMFFVIGKFVAIPTPIPNFALYLQYIILITFGFYFGPITGFVVGFFGHLLIDLLSGYGLWFSWIISSGVFGLLVGLSSILINRLGNPYKPSKMVLFSLLVTISGAICWILIAPVGDILFYKAPYSVVFVEGIIALAGNVSTALIVGLPIIYALKRVRKPYSVVSNAPTNGNQINMPKATSIKCIIDTQNRKERMLLRDYLAKQHIAYSVNRKDNDFHLVAITEYGVGYIGVIVAHDLVNNQGYKHFSSVNEYIEANNEC